MVLRSNLRQTPNPKNPDPQETPTTTGKPLRVSPCLGTGNANPDAWGRVGGRAGARTAPRPPAEAERGLGASALPADAHPCATSASAPARAQHPPSSSCPAASAAAGAAASISRGSPGRRRPGTRAPAAAWLRPSRLSGNRARPGAPHPLGGEHAQWGGPARPRRRGSRSLPGALGCGE